MQELLKNIDAYGTYLREQLGLSVSIHFGNAALHSTPPAVFKALTDYNAHHNPYCTFVKRDCWHQCVATQREILYRDDLPVPFWHICHAGVKEYVCPFGKKEMIGYVAVSGYREETAPEKCYSAQLWTENLNPTLPPQELLDAVIPPFCRMLELLYTYPLEADVHGEYYVLLQFLHEQHGQVTLEDVCRHLGRSRSSVSHLFHEKNELSLPAYCTELKLNYAKLLLENKTRSITEVAMDAGFNDVSYFIAKFKAKFGITPLQYRKKL